jgi:Golgi SNAP receptor complex protein 2
LGAFYSYQDQAINNRTELTVSILPGQINASLSSFSRTIDDYNKLTKQELVPEKQAKAFERLKTFKSELGDYRDSLDRIKQEATERVRLICAARAVPTTFTITPPHTQWLTWCPKQQATLARTDLFARRPHHTATTPDNPYASAPTNSNPFGATASSSSAYASNDPTRESHAMREQSFMQNTHAQLDGFLDFGADVLANLGQQKEMLKGAQRRLYSVGTSLGIGADTIRMVERRAKQDKWIFWGCLVVFIVFCYFVLKWLRWCCWHDRLHCMAFGGHWYHIIPQGCWEAITYSIALASSGSLTRTLYLK